jgi:hypothetical protein
MLRILQVSLLLLAFYLPLVIDASAIPDAITCATDRNLGFVNAIHCAFAASLRSAAAEQPDLPEHALSCSRQAQSKSSTHLDLKSPPWSL